MFPAFCRICHDTPSHTVREPFLQGLYSVPQRYTLTYSEGTANRHKRLLLSSIHPHIQWGNVRSGSVGKRRIDTPSHTVREPDSAACSAACCRYTLTYSEGTFRRHPSHRAIPIHPHIQWGNGLSNCLSSNRADTPSHTVREPFIYITSIPVLRYTLTYSEGTFPTLISLHMCPIHPHIQWGNLPDGIIYPPQLDTPSHTVREQKPRCGGTWCTWYTLTYSEGTWIAIQLILEFSIHPHIQWGNLVVEQLKIRYPDTPSHTVREQSGVKRHI